MRVQHQESMYIIVVLVVLYFPESNKFFGTSKMLLASVWTLRARMMKNIKVKQQNWTPSLLLGLVEGNA